MIAYALTFNFTFGWWLAPALLSLYPLYEILTGMFGESRGSFAGNGSFYIPDLTSLFKAFWFIPLFGIWCIYFAIMYFTK